MHDIDAGPTLTITPATAEVDKKPPVKNDGMRLIENQNFDDVVADWQKQAPTMEV